MRAVSCLQGALSVVDVPTPQPGRGQLLLDVRRCGICGSDIHARTHADELATAAAAVGYDDSIRSDTPTVLGHEFCGEVVERGRGVGKEFTPGTTVVSFPLLRAHGGVHLTGLSPLAPGAYAERVLAEASLSFAVPNGLDVDTAALTEPMAVALHAVRRSEIGRRDVAVVIGCGPVGLAVICHLKARGVRTIVASDFSPGRRTLATRCGATVVVDAATASPYDPLKTEKGVITSATGLYELGVGSMEKLRKLPGWAHLYRVADRLGAAGPKRPVIFECVGVPGMIDGVVAAAPLGSRVIVVGGRLHAVPAFRY
jgi:threonine dehydrogenase-like Zn-dependent dehydrogenase